MSHCHGRGRWAYGCEGGGVVVENYQTGVNVPLKELFLVHLFYFFRNWAGFQCGCVETS